MTSTQENAAAVANVTTHPKRVAVPSFFQQAATECGAASLGMILAHYGRWITLDQLREECGVDRNGASAQAVADAGEANGLSHEGLSLTTEALNGVSVPAMIWWRRSHFMVLEGAHGGKFYVNDPARGRYELRTDEFDEGYSGVVVTFQPKESFTKEGSRYHPSKGLWKRLKNSVAGVNFAIYTGVLGMILALALAPINQVFINDVLGSARKSLLTDLIGALFVIGLFRAGLNLLQYGVLARLQAKFTLVGTVGMVDRLLRLPLIFYMERAAGDLSQRISYNTVVAQVLAGQMASAAISMLAVAGYAALLFYYNWIIAIVVLVLTAINVVVLRLVQRQRTDSENRILRRQNELRGLTTASIRDIETLKSTGREDETFVSLEGQQAEYISATAALVPTSALLAALPTAIMALVSASILILGGIFTIQGTFTIGALLAVQSLASSLSSPIQTLMGTGSQIQTVTSSLNAIDDVLTNKESVRFSRPTLKPGEKVPEISGHLRLDRVSFGYGDKAPLVLQDFSLEVKPGHRIALVGTSGAGKTTIGNIAAGLLMPRSGSVFYDEKTIDQYPIGVLENYISKVDQNIVLFEGTVRQNVTLWDDSIQEDQIVSALEDAQILDDVLARPGSIDARVEEDGRNFSGGQAQRIEIARSLVRNPRLLIMDEATSALDDITEKLVDNAVRRRGVAALIIAHRLSTIRDSDEIIVLGRGGQVLERGTHDDLMGLNGLYRKMIQEAGEGGNVGS